VTIKDTHYNNRSSTYKNILTWVKTLSIPEREKIIDEIQIDAYFDNYDKSEMVINE
jgi:hypothetical protein